MRFLDFWKNMSRILKILVVVGVMLFAWTAWEAFTGDQNAKDWENRYNDFREHAAEVSVRADSLEQLVAILMIEADGFSDRIREKEKANEELKGEIVRLKDLLRPISDENEKTFAELTGGQSIETVLARSFPKSEPWIRLSFGLRNENILLEQTNLLLTIQSEELEGTLLLAHLEAKSLRTALGLALERGASLQGIIDALPEPPGAEKFLGIIPLPSRKASLWIGVAGGVITSAIIVSAFND